MGGGRLLLFGLFVAVCFLAQGNFNCLKMDKRVMV